MPSSRDITTVTGEAVTRRLERGYVTKALKGQPGSEIVFFTTKTQPFQEDNLVSTQAVREYLALVWQQYKLANRKMRSTILDEVCRNLKMHRKAVIRALNASSAPRSVQGKGAKTKNRRYSDASKEALILVWRQMNYMASLRLRAAMKDWLPHFRGCSEPVKEELLRMSSKTMDRYLKAAKAELNRKINSGTRRGLRKMVTEIPIRNLGEKPDELGHCEVDSVAHCGESMSGTFAWTITLTDIMSGWTESEAVWGKDGKNVVRALKGIEQRLPFAIRAFYFDNGSEFLNEDVFNEFIKSKDRKQKIKIFRSRPYRKNDQCYVEQKNYTHVRLLMGYGRIDWKKAIALMNNAYRNEWSKIQNLFSPQQQLLEKIREGSKVRRWMSEAKTPLERLGGNMPDKDYQRLMIEKKSTDPFKTNTALKKKVRTMFGYFKNSIPKSQRGKILQ